MKMPFGLNRRWIAVVVVSPLLVFLIVFAFVQMSINAPGPSAEEAFRRYIKNPVPNSVTDFQIHYAPHMRGYSMYLVFRIAPKDLESLFDIREFEGAVPSVVMDGKTEYPGWAGQFQKLDPDGFVDMMTKGSHCAKGDFKQAASWNCHIVVSSDHRKVYWFRFQD
jgi:hypothetical protein